MTREEAIYLLQNEPGVKVSHINFSSEEYIYGKGGSVYDEEGYLFEDWESEGPAAHNGVRMRIGGNWESNWHEIGKI